MMQRSAIIMLFSVFLWSVSFSGQAQNSLAYQKPARALEELINLPTEPVMSLSPDRRIILLCSYDRFLSSSQGGERRTVTLAGVKFDTHSNLPADKSWYTAISFKYANRDSATYPIKGLPAHFQLVDYKWSYDSQHLGLAVLEEKGVRLWVVDIKTRKARRIYEGYLNFSLVEEELFAWLPQEKAIVFAAIPDRGQAEPMVSSRKPAIYENDRHTLPQRTYQGLLKSEADEALFEYYATTQLKKVDMKGRVSNIGKSGIIASFAPSPDGKYLKVHYVKKPYSYTLTFHRFPSDIVILGRNGKEVAKKELPAVIRPLGRDAAYQVPRDFAWRTDVGATLTWVEAKDGGDPKIESRERDQLWAWQAPFDKVPRLLQTSSLRAETTYWVNDSLAIMVEKWWTNRSVNWLLFNPLTGRTLDTLMVSGNQGPTIDPGVPVQVKTAGLKKLLFQDGSIFLSRKTQNEKGEVVPVLEKFHLTRKRSDEIWRSSAPYYEYPVAFENGPGSMTWIMARQSRTIPNNLVRLDLENLHEEVLTYNSDKLSLLNTSLVKKELSFLRSDSIPLRATLYYNKDSVRDDRLMGCLIYAYPLDYIRPADAGAVTANPYRYEANLSLQKLLALSGYAVLDNTSFPIIGRKGSHPNDTYLEQIELNAQAAIRAAGKTGLIDTGKVAVIGHSYGAFMVANLLTHTNLFKTGVALSGAYNRSLTPFGFQREYRTYWEEQALYHRLSPLQNADKLAHPILLFHGELDENPGTHYSQSEQYFAALKGLGKTVRFVSLPGEPHSYGLRASYLHILWEVDHWLRKHFREDPALKASSWADEK
ncbi:alpha/beta fold hydrolase [Pontibacter sp. HSC-14F20]|uniref:alpha/beta hydrolase family protein n=1 Tax=Pontibacter sp. HSC-14F20 TaxID=2864136 RepID=UPI001C73B470|nr:alpha/beta fold hydrolase [Pontibacter sp. HSC-14F20]MBX0335336.1 alpha/beta fold hydrolase [Pontibacter sp. HSC-14F20]